MNEKYVPVNDSVYDALTQLQSNLSNEYGEDITISDTIDFLGHQFFVHTGILDIAGSYMKMMAKTREKNNKPGVMGWLLQGIGLAMPEDATCFIRSNIDVPLHWVHTRWILDIQGKNMLRCLTEPGADSKASGDET